MVMAMSITRSLSACSSNMGSGLQILLYIKITCNLYFLVCEEFLISLVKVDVVYKTRVISCSILREEDLKRIKRKRKGEGSRRRSTPQLEHLSPRILLPALSADSPGCPMVADVFTNKCKYHHIQLVQTGNINVVYVELNLVKMNLSIWAE